MANLSTEQLLLLNNVLYMDPKFMGDQFATSANADRGLSLGEYFDSFDTSRYSASGQDGSFIAGSDWNQMIGMIKSDPTLSNIRLADTYSDANGGYAAVFVDPSTNDAIVTFRGTGGKEWQDNFQGGASASTAQQEAALGWFSGNIPGESGEFLDMSQYNDVTVTGHSKGGNKAKYITVHNDAVDHCVSFDGQGFSEQFITENSDAILRNRDKIENHNVDGDFVNILLNDIGETTYYEGHGIDGNFARNHSPDSYFDKNGNLIPGPQSESMQAFDQFLNSYIRSMPESERAEAMGFIGGLVEDALAGKLNADDALRYLSNPQNRDEAAYLAAFLLKYEQEVGLTGHLGDALNQIGMSDMMGIINIASGIINNDIVFFFIKQAADSLGNIPGWVIDLVCDKFGIDDPELLKQLLQTIGLIPDKYDQINSIPYGGDRRVLTPEERANNPFLRVLDRMRGNIETIVTGGKNLILAYPDELLAAARDIEQAVLEYEHATDTARSAANQLLAQWSGRAADAFYDEQQRTFLWYDAMADIARQQADFLRRSATSYHQADQSATKFIHG